MSILLECGMLVAYVAFAIVLCDDKPLSSPLYACHDFVSMCLFIYCIIMMMQHLVGEDAPGALRWAIGAALTERVRSMIKKHCAPHEVAQAKEKAAAKEKDWQLVLERRKVTMEKKAAIWKIISRRNEVKRMEEEMIRNYRRTRSACEDPVCMMCSKEASRMVAACNECLTE